MSQHRFGGTWTDKKVETVRKYLAGYTMALKNQPFRRNYIDAFAGTGERTVKESEDQMRLDVPELDEVLKGSARVALGIDPPFDAYLFIEKSKSKSAALNALAAEYPERTISVFQEEANQAIRRICQSTNWRSNRAVLFLDPYGMQVEWDTLVAVAATKAIDVWILYPSGMGMNRLLTNDGNIPPEWQQTLDRFLGCSDWRQAFYKVVETTDLFGTVTVDNVKEASTAKFEEFFLTRLKTIFAGVAERTVPLNNSKGNTMYLLCFACGNPKGAAPALRIANSVMKEKAT
jgi:three-Cys-motif partner protein